MKTLNLVVNLLLFAGISTFAADETIGKRPYEMDWAGRTQDANPSIIDFENIDGWTVDGKNMEVKFERTREQQLFGSYVGKLTYRATGNDQRFSFGPPQPVKITQPFDAVTCWIYGNTWGYERKSKTPQVSVSAIFNDSKGRQVTVRLATVNWKEWYLCHERLTPEQIEMVKDGASFVRFEIGNARQKEDRVLYFDSLAVFTEKFPPLAFEPRPERGILMFPGQSVGNNKGPGKLPFPNRPQTILPDNLTDKFRTSVVREGDSFVFTYKGSDGKLTYTLTPKTGTFGDLAVQWKGRGGTMRPCVDGGAWLGDKPAAPEKIEPLGEPQLGDGVVTTHYRVTLSNQSAEVSYYWRLWNKSLVIDTIAKGGLVSEVHYGHAENVDNPRLVTNPYYHYGYNLSRPAVVVAGPANKPLFLTGNTDWYLSNASTPFSVNEIKDGRVSYQGGTRYVRKTDGKRNDVYDRFFITVSPRYEEILPTLPNPKSPYMGIAGTHVWRAHGAGNREHDAAYWRNVWRHGMRECVITDHETGWRDGGESFTFRTRPAPGKGGDKGQYDYARLMQDELGFVYGPYNNFTDFAPVNEFWSFDIASRTPENQLAGAWMRCYAPKPSRAVEYCAKLAPEIQKKFKFSTAYCDVHTAVSPWERVDYDARVPGAGTFAATFYSFGEIMLHQKNAWQGPVYSEGNHHFYYCGLTDGNYAQDRGYDIPDKPWLVDLDLRKIHDLCCNFGMGNPEMFYGRDETPGNTQEERDAFIDRFLAATVAFGHPGFLTMEGGFQNALRSYFMLQQLHSSYTLASAVDIRYVSADGDLLDSSSAIASGDYKRSQIVTRYSNGTVTVVNGSRTDRLKLKIDGHRLDLPPNGYAGWTKDGAVNVLSSDSDGHRSDYAETPVYIYVDGRGKFTRHARAASDGIGICRILPDSKYEIIPYQNADCGFRINASSAVALDKENKEMGPAQLRISRGYTFVIPVKGAFSYLLKGTTGDAVAGKFACSRDNVVAGETVTVKGADNHEVRIPANTKDGQRVWQELEGSWIDFTVVPLCEAGVDLADNNTLRLKLISNLPSREKMEISVLDKEHDVVLKPGRSTEVLFNLGELGHEDAILLGINFKAGNMVQKIERGLRTISAPVEMAELPLKYEIGIGLRGKPETSDFGVTHGSVSAHASTCGGVAKPGIAMHPPYTGAVGYSFAQYEALTLPKDMPTAFRALVGKGDGSAIGDGILYKVTVKDGAGKETMVTEQVVMKHEWTPIIADLTPWVGQKIRIKLVADAGKKDNTSGDWACWAEMTLKSLNPVLRRFIEDDGALYRREPAPIPLKGITQDDLRKATKGSLHYDGLGFSGGGQYGCNAVLNGVDMGFMAAAGGGETKGIWATNVVMSLTPEAIKTLQRRNVLGVLNPNHDSFKLRRFWLELELADGRKASSEVAAVVFTQPPEWPYAEGIKVPADRNVEVDLWFNL